MTEYFNAGQMIPPTNVTDVQWTTKDSGKRATFDSGMVRDTEEGKARFDLLVPEGVPYEEQLLTRFAALMARGAEKYSARNWEKARGAVELARFRASAFRHFMQWFTGCKDEDHAAAVWFNMTGAEFVEYRQRVDGGTRPVSLIDQIKREKFVRGSDVEIALQTATNARRKATTDGDSKEKCDGNCDKGSACPEWG